MVDQHMDEAVLTLAAERNVQAPDWATPGHEPEFDIEPRRLRVLVIEDEQADREIIDSCLRRMCGFEAEITLAGNVQAAEFAVTHGGFDIVLVDYSMSDSLGIDLIPHVVANARCPALLVTGMLTSEVEAEALELGAQACLSKDDLSPRVLETLIRQAVQAHIMTRTLRLLGQASAGPRVPATPRGRRLTVDGEGEIVDLQALIADVVHSARRVRPARAAIGDPVIRLELNDRPIYVFDASLRLGPAIARVLRSCREATVAMQSVGAFAELLISARTATGAAGELLDPFVGLEGLLPGVIIERERLADVHYASLLLPVIDRRGEALALPHRDRRAALTADDTVVLDGRLAARLAPAVGSVM
jgi:CheY-like chemotaxis protein